LRGGRGVERWNMKCPHYEVARGLEYVFVGEDGKAVETGEGGDVSVAVLESYLGD